VEAEHAPEVLDITPHRHAHLVLHADRVLEDEAAIARLHDDKGHAHEILGDAVNGHVLVLDRTDVLYEAAPGVHRPTRAVNVKDCVLGTIHLSRARWMTPIQEDGVDRTGGHRADEAHKIRLVENNGPHRGGGGRDRKEKYTSPYIHNHYSLLFMMNKNYLTVLSPSHQR